MPKLEVERKFQISREKYEELLKTATDAPSVQHHDLYFDSATYQLSQKDWWLRWRDGRWDLKVPAQHGLDKDSSASTRFWELEDEALICQHLGITSLPSHEQQPEVISKAAFEAQLKDVDSGQLAADLISADGIPHMHFQLCANMHTQRFNIKSAEDERVTLALDTVTFNPSMPIEQAVEEKTELIICEIEIMLDDDAIETRRLAEMALDEEIDRLGLRDCLTGRSKLFTYLQQYSPAQYEIWLHRSDEQKLNSLLLKAECKWQQTRLQMPPVTVKPMKIGGSDEGNSSKEPEWLDEHTLWIGSATTNTPTEDKERFIEPEGKYGWWRRKGSSIWYECPHGAVRVRGRGRAESCRGHFGMQATVPRCHEPDCIHRMMRAYENMKDIDTMVFWPADRDTEPLSAMLKEESSPPLAGMVAVASTEQLPTDLEECTCEWSHAGGFKQCQGCADKDQSRKLQQRQVSINAARLKQSKKKTDVKRLKDILKTTCPWAAKSNNGQAWQQLQRNAEYMLRQRQEGLLFCHYAEGPFHCPCNSQPLQIFGWQEASRMSVEAKAEQRMATVDHVLPRSKGGTDTDDNRVIACYHCNAAKADRLLEEAEISRVNRSKEASKGERDQSPSDANSAALKNVYSKLFRCKFVADVSPWRCERLPRGSKTTVRVRLRNEGELAWPADTRLQFLCGSKPHRRIRRRLGVVAPGECVEVDIPTVIPCKNEVYATHYHVGSRAAPDGERLFGCLRVEAEVSQGSKVCVHANSGDRPLYQRVVAACVQVLEKEDDSYEDEWEELAEEETTSQHSCECCIYHPGVMDDLGLDDREVQVCADLERAGNPTVETLAKHRSQKALKPFIIDRYEVHDIGEGHLWLPVPRGDEATGPSRLPRNRWASERLQTTVYGPALLVRRQDLDHLRRLEARHDDMHISTTQQADAHPRHKSKVRTVHLGCQPVRTRLQELRRQTCAPGHDENCAGCREARNLSMADHYAKGKNSLPKPTHTHCHQCGAVSRAEGAELCPHCDMPAAARRREVWASPLALQAEQGDPTLEAIEEGEPATEEYREDVMIFPCTLLPDDQGDLVPHVAIHQSEGNFHPIGGKIADEPWLKEETPTMALKRELLEEATDDEPVANQLTQWAQVAQPSTAWYDTPGGDHVRGRLWSVVTDLPVPLRRKEPTKHDETSYVTVQEVFSDEQRWARASLFKAAKHEVERALRLSKAGQSALRWQEAMTPITSGNQSGEQVEGVLLQVDAEALQAKVLIAQQRNSHGTHYCCPVNADMRATERAAALNRIDSRLQELPRAINLDARLMEGDDRRRVWGGLLTTEAAQEIAQWPTDGDGYRVRAVPLHEFLKGDMEWRKQWRNPMQLLRMQVAALDVYMAALEGQRIPPPPKPQRQDFLRLKEQVEEWRSRHCWAVEEMLEQETRAQGNAGQGRCMPMFSWLHKYPLAEARTRRRITLPKGDHMVTLAFSDMFGEVYETPPGETSRTCYALTTHPRALTFGNLQVISGSIGVGRRQQEIYIRNVGPHPITIPAHTPLGALTEPNEAEKDPATNYLIKNYAVELQQRHRLDLSQHQTEEELWNQELQEPVKTALLHAAKQMGRSRELHGEPGEELDSAKMARRLSEAQPATSEERWDELTQLVARVLPGLARGDNRAAREVAVQLHVSAEKEHGVPIPVLRHEANEFYRHAMLETASWQGRQIAWGHVYQEPETLEQLNGMRRQLEALTARAQREQPASLVVLCQAGWQGKTALRDMRRQGFEEIELDRQSKAYFETDRHIGRGRFKRTSDAQGTLKVLWYRPPRPAEGSIHTAIVAQDATGWSETEVEAAKSKCRALVEQDATLQPEERHEVVERVVSQLRAQPGGVQLLSEGGEQLRLLLTTIKDKLDREKEDAELLEMARKTLADDGLMTAENKEQMLAVLKPHLRHTLNPKNLGRTSMFGKFHIDTGDARPVRTVPWRVSPKEKEIIRTEVRKMLDLGVVEPSDSPWCTQVVLVKKKDLTYRMAIDYRGLNTVTCFDASPIPRVDDSIATLQGKKFFSLADLNSGFWQLELDDESKPKTAFGTSDGLYHFTTMPMGLSTASQSWQRLMNNLINGHLQDFCCAYIDDLIIHSVDWDSHLEHVDKTLRRFAEAGLTLKLRKCVWGAREVQFLGHIVQGDSIRPSPEKTAAIRAFKKPRNIHQLRAFLGLCNWYRRFIGNFALIAAPLVALTKKENHGLIEMRMDDADCIRAFEALKDALCHPDLMLLQPNHDKDFRVETDACDYQLGAVLTQQDQEGNWRPVEYWSRRLTPAEYNQRQTPTYLEAIAIFEATTRWRHFLISRPFEVVSDHQALVSLPTRKSATDRLTRIQLSLQDFTYKVLYRQGEDNVVPDALSRIDTEDTGEGPDPADVHQTLPERTLAESYKRWQGYELLDQSLRPTQGQTEHVLEATVDLAKGKQPPKAPGSWQRTVAPSVPGLPNGRLAPTAPEAQSSSDSNKRTPIPTAPLASTPIVHSAPLTRSVTSRLNAAAADRDAPAPPYEPPSELHSGSRMVGRFVRKRFGAVWYLGKVVEYTPAEQFDDLLPGYRIFYEADGDEEEVNEEQLHSILLDADPAKWPKPLLAGAGQPEHSDTPEPTRWSWPCDVTEAREEAERRLITPCRILPGYEPMSGPDEHRYLHLPDDDELLKAQKEDVWCKEIASLVAQLKGEGVTESQEADIIKQLCKHDIPRPEVKQWFVEPGTGLLMREGYMRDRVKRRDVVKSAGKKGPSLAEVKTAQRAAVKKIVPQRVIPLALRPDLLYAHHGHITAGHKGVNRVREAMARTVWWPKINSDIKRHIQGCRCPKGYRELRQERPKLTKSLLQESQAFGQHISVDCSGIGPETRHGNRVFLVIVDTFSLYTCVVALPAATAQEVARALIQHWFSYFGLPLTLHADGGPEFHNNLLSNIARQLQIKTTRISPLNPSGNTLAENAVKKTKQQITELVGDYYDTWDEYAALVTWTYNASMNERTGAIPMAVAFGQLPRGIVDLALPPLKPERDREGHVRAEWTDYRTAIMDVLQKSNEWVRRANEDVTREKAGAEQERKKGYEVQVGDSVWHYNPMLRVKRHRQYYNCWTGPFLVHAVSKSRHTATLQIEGGRRLKSVNVRQLRKYQSPLMATYGGAPRTLAALPVRIVAYRERVEESGIVYQYLTRLHTDTSFQDWVDAELLPRALVLEFWRLLDCNPYLRDYEPLRQVVVMMPDRSARLHEGTIQERKHNLLRVQLGGGDSVLAYITPTGTIRSAETTTEAEGRERDAHARQREPDSVGDAEPMVIAEPGVLRGESIPTEGGVAPDAVRITRSGRTVLRAGATHMHSSRWTTNNDVDYRIPVTSKLGHGWVRFGSSLDCSAAARQPSVVRPVLRGPLGRIKRHDERHPRVHRHTRKCWHPPWDAFVEEEESEWQTAIRAVTLVTM